MAAPGTLTHVLEVAAQLSVTAAEHADSLQRTASAAVHSPGPSAADATAPSGH